MADDEPPVRVAASQSFTSEEIRVLDYVLDYVLEHLRLTRAMPVVTRRASYASLCRKVLVMKRRLTVVKKLRAQSEEP